MKHEEKSIRNIVLLIIYSSIADTVRPSCKVACTMLGIFAVPMLSASFFAANYSALPSVFLLFLLCLASLYCHEAAHLTALRFLTGDRRQGNVKSSWTQLWVIGATPLTPIRTMAVASLGPVSGAASALLPLAWGFHSLPCFLLAALHLSNLMPFFPDGKVIILGLFSLLFEKLKK